MHASDLVFMRVSLAGLSRREIRNCLYSRAFVGQKFVLRAQLATVQGHPRRKFSKILKISFSAFKSLRLFQSFLKAYLYKLIQVDLFGVLAENLGRRKF